MAAERTITIDALAAHLGARVDGDGTREVRGCAPVDRAGPDEITFLSNPRYLRHVGETRAAGILIDETTSVPGHVTRIVCADPYFAFRNALVHLRGFRAHPDPMDAEQPDGAGRLISTRALVHESATVGEGARIHGGAVVERYASIGRNTILYPGAYVGASAAIGEDCVLFPNVTVYDRCLVGDRVLLHASVAVGSDGFGYATHGGAHHKIPQVGIAIIEDDVELGAGCVVERGALGDTRIGRGTKMADLVSIGHGTEIGEHCLIVSLVGISGSSEIGKYVVLGGQTGVGGHLRVGDGVQAQARTGVTSDIEPGLRIGGFPATPLPVARRNLVASMQVGELAARVRRLERALARLEGESDAAS